MPAINFTIITRLSLSGIEVDYFNDCITKQERLFRIIYNLIDSGEWSTDSKLNTYIQNTFQVDKRTANTLIKGAKGRKKALAALKKVELSGIETKQETVIKEINNLKDEINKMKPKVTSNKATDIELISYRRNKKSLFSKQQKLERLKHKIDKLEKQILNNKFSICWGTLSASFCYAHLFFFDYSLEEISTGFKIKRCA